MSNLKLRHPSGDQLLHFVDVELPPPQAGELRNHLTACWQCRTELEEIERTIGEYVRYRKTVVETCLPLPPAPWFDIYRLLDSIDESERPAYWSGCGRRFITRDDGCPPPLSC
jgi:hypothetical protein